MNIFEELGHVYAQHSILKRKLKNAITELEKKNKGNHMASIAFSLTSDYRLIENEIKEL